MKITLSIFLLSLALGLGACSGRSLPDAGDDSAGSGPTVYGKVSVSVDHVDTR